MMWAVEYNPIKNRVYQCTSLIDSDLQQRHLLSQHSLRPRPEQGAELDTYISRQGLKMASNVQRLLQTLLPPYGLGQNGVSLKEVLAGKCTAPGKERLILICIHFSSPPPRFGSSAQMVLVANSVIKSLTLEITCRPPGRQRRHSAGY